MYTMKYRLFSNISKRAPSPHPCNILITKHKESFTFNNFVICKVKIDEKQQMKGDNDASNDELWRMSSRPYHQQLRLQTYHV